MAAPTQVFCFHRVSDEFSPAYPPIPVKTFERVCAFLDRNYLIIPVSELRTNFTSKKNRAVITFDDAYLDFFQNALPILVKYRLPAIQHVITSSAENGKSFWTQRLNKVIEVYLKSEKNLCFPELKINEKVKNGSQAFNLALHVYKYLLSKKNREFFIQRLEDELDEKVTFTSMMTWAEIKEACKFNVVVGSHTHTHENLVPLNDSDLCFELEHSLKLIKENTGEQEAFSIAYPNGQVDSRVMMAAKIVGYQIGFSTLPRSIKRDDNPLNLPRLSVYNPSWLKNYVKLNYWKYFL